MVRQLAAGTFLVVFIVLATVFGHPREALAGPVEELVQVAVNPADPEMMVLRYEYSGDGLLYTRDGGETFQFVCGSSVNSPEDEEGPLTKLGPIGIGGDGKVLLGVFGGLWKDDGKGCSWSRDSDLVDRWVTDIVPHPSDPGVAFLITSNGGEAVNGIIRRNADGTLTELGSKKAILISRLRVAEKPDGKLRFYESAVLGQVVVEQDGGPMTTKPNYAIRVSDDDGETWTEHEIGVVDGQLRLEAVDPTNPDRIVVSISRDKDTETNTPLPDPLMISENGGESFEDWAEVTKFGGIAFGENGEVWIGDGGDTTAPDAPRGILHAAALGEELEVITNDYPVQCLHKTSDKLFVCQRFSFGTASLEDGTYAPAVELAKLETMNQCDGVDNADVCRTQLCTGYCGSGHFARAPMCKAAYNSTEEMGCASVGAGGAGGGVVAGAGGSGGDAGSAGGTGGAGGTNGGTSGGDGDTDSGVTEEPAPKSDSSGCGCSVPGHSQRGAWAGLGMLGLAALIARRRRS